jgi:hypothetical protein
MDNIEQHGEDCDHDESDSIEPAGDNIAPADDNIEPEDDIALADETEPSAAVQPSPQPNLQPNLQLRRRAPRPVLKDTPVNVMNCPGPFAVYVPNQDFPREWKVNQLQQRLDTLEATKSMEVQAGMIALKTMGFMSALGFAGLTILFMITSIWSNLHN